jgi:hypothetical protein
LKCRHARFCSQRTKGQTLPPKTNPSLFHIFYNWDVTAIMSPLRNLERHQTVTRWPRYRHKHIETPCPCSATRSPHVAPLSNMGVTHIPTFIALFSSLSGASHCRKPYSLCMLSCRFRSTSDWISPDAPPYCLPPPWHHS